jgi:hypothetical protein
MILATRIFIIAISLLFIVFIVALVSRSRLLLKYSLLWLALSVLVCICAVFPQPLYALSDLLGFQTAANFIYLIGLFFLLAIALSLSVIVSKQTANIKTLIQEIALLKNAQKKETGERE